MVVNRRAFLSRFVKGACATAAVAALAPDELFTPEPIRTYFLPPAHGWMSGGGPFHFSELSDPNRFDPGISLRFVKDFNIQTDRFPARFDMLMGRATIRPELAGILRFDDGDAYAPFTKDQIDRAAKRMADDIDRRILEEYLRPAIQEMTRRGDEALMKLAQQQYPSPSLKFHKDAFSLVMP